MQRINTSNTKALYTKPSIDVIRLNNSEENMVFLSSNTSTSIKGITGEVDTTKINLIPSKLK